MIIARLRRVFDLAADPDAIEWQLAVDPLMARLIEARPGLRVPGGWDGFELALRAVLGQQITVAGAIKLAGKLVARFGQPLRQPDGHPSGLTHVFPEPSDLTGADLMSLGMPRSRSATLTAVSEALVADPRLFDAGASLQDAVARFCELRGIGDWTAQYISLRQLREPDAFPAGDVALLKALGLLEGTTPTSRQMLARAEAWRPWRAYAAQHLWTSLAAPGAGPVPG